MTSIDTASLVLKLNRALGTTQDLKHETEVFLSFLETHLHPRVLVLLLTDINSQRLRLAGIRGFTSLQQEWLSIPIDHLSNVISNILTEEDIDATADFMHFSLKAGDRSIGGLLVLTNPDIPDPHVIYTVLCSVAARNIRNVQLQRQVNNLTNDMTHSLEALHQMHGEFLKLTDELEDKVIQRTLDLAISEERYRSIVNNVPLGIYTIKNRLITYANNTFHSICQSIGLSSKNSLLINSIEHQARRKILEAHYAVLTGADNQRLDIELYDNHGVLHSVTLWVLPFPTKGETPPTLQGIVWDNSRSRRAETAAQETEAVFRSIFQAATDGIMITDSTGLIVNVNPAWAVMSGYEVDELIGMQVTDLLYQDIPAHLGQPIDIGIWAIHCKDGQHRNIEINVKPIMLANRQYMLAMARDITQRLQIEQKREAAITRLRELDEMKDRLIHMINHEIRTPLSGILGFASLLNTRSFPPERQQEFAGIIHQETAHLAQMLDRFHDTQQIENGRLSFRKHTVNINELIRGTVNMQEVQHSATHHFTLELEEIPSIKADINWITQILTNLLSNAVKYSPNGGEITIHTTLTADRIYVSIQDKGLGIPPDEAHRLFRKFSRIQNAQHQQVRGTGLGLLLCKLVIEAHGGQIWMESEGLGKGSNFSFYLPCTPQEIVPAL